MPHWLGQRAALTPDRVALICDNEEYTFSQLNQFALQTAECFVRLGVQAGDRVALLFNNSLSSVEMVHALTYIGAIFVPLNNRLTAEELIWPLNDAQVSLLVYDLDFSEKVDSITGKVGNVQVVSSESLSQSQKTDSVENDTKLASESTTQFKQELNLDELQAIMYTSGTTGHPKGVMLTYGNHWWSAIGSALNLGLAEHDRWLVCLPFFHVGGLSILWRSVIYGIPVVVHNGFDAQAVNKAIQNQQVTIVSVVSNMLARMLSDLKQNRETYPDTFRCMLLGGGAAPKPLLEECVQQGVPVFQTYGLTETGSQIVTLSPEFMLSKQGSAGKPLFPTELRIEKDGETQPAGQEGEIVVRGPNVTQGYLHNLEATEKAFKDDWLYTGDIGYVDEEGFLYVLDRRQDLIISGGENVYPAEIEAVLLAHSYVNEAGVTGQQNDMWGHVPVAFVTLAINTMEAEAVEAELLHFCGQRLAKFKTPARIYILQELPRNATNKLLRRKLLDLIPD